jgi:hypothetical protein
MCFAVICQNGKTQPLGFHKNIHYSLRLMISYLAGSGMPHATAPQPVEALLLGYNPSGLAGQLMVAERHNSPSIHPQIAT